MNRLPDFFIIGAMKSGSTSLWHHLAGHPDLYLCTPKEPQYFSGRKGWSKGAAWYHSLFESASPGALCGEASTCYSRYPHYGDVAQRIADANPSARFVYILRDPADRVYSHYLHECQQRSLAGQPVLTFRESWRSDPEYLDASRYHDQILRYLRYFDREQLFLCSMEDLVTSPGTLVRQIVDFLGRDPSRLPETNAARVDNQSLGDFYARAVGKHALQDILHRFPVMARASRVFPHAVRERVKRGLLEMFQRAQGAKAVTILSDRVSQYTVDDRAELLSHLGESTKALQEWWGRDLSRWLNPCSGGGEFHADGGA